MAGNAPGLGRGAVSAAVFLQPRSTVAGVSAPGCGQEPGSIAAGTPCRDAAVAGRRLPPLLPLPLPSHSAACLGCPAARARPACGGTIHA